MDTTKGCKNYNPQLNSLRQVVMGCEDYTLHPHLLCLAFILKYAGRLSGFYGGLPTKKHRKHAIQSAVGHCLGGTKIILGCAKSEQI